MTMNTATMNTSELLQKDREIGNALDTWGTSVAAELLRLRREVRAELNKRHES
jgi:hypothetical protein